MSRGVKAGVPSVLLVLDLAPSPPPPPRRRR
jgi:hypothetical protein